MTIDAEKCEIRPQDLLTNLQLRAPEMRARMYGMCAVSEMLTFILTESENEDSLADRGLRESYVIGGLVEAQNALAFDAMVFFERLENDVREASAK